MGIDLVATLSDLVRLPSVNPMGRPVTGDIYFEHRMTEYLQELFQTLGVPWTRQEVTPQRENIVARLDGDTPIEQGGPLLMLEAHQDTVPVDGMTIPPFTPTIADGKLYGRGSCDIKGGMASMLWAFAKLVEERPANRPTVLMACSVNEEHGFYGARELAQLWQQPVAGAVVPRRPDAVIVAEPTLLNVVVAHKGTVRWRCRTSGRAAHSSRPELGDNAIYHMARVLKALEIYARDEAPALTRHRLVGHPTLSVGVVSGGISVNTVPDDCYIEIDRRVVPGENPHEARAKVIAYVAANTPWPSRTVAVCRRECRMARTRRLTRRPERPRSSSDRGRSTKRIRRTNGWKSPSCIPPAKSCSISRGGSRRSALSALKVGKTLGETKTHVHCFASAATD
jgi:acetylornithine deacetylase